MADSKRVLLFAGATGALGRPVAEHLRDAGCHLRLLCRDIDKARAMLGAGFEYIQGDIRNIDQVTDAMKGVAGVYLNLKSGHNFDPASSIEIQGANNVIKAAERCPIDWLGVISGAGDTGVYQHLPPIRIKHQVERSIVESGLNYTIFKPTHFMESLPMFVHDGKPAIPGRQPNTWHYIAARDYAGIVLDAWRDGGWNRREVNILGPEPFTMKAALTVYSRLCLRGEQVSTIPLPIFTLLARLKGDEAMQTVAVLFRAFREMDETIPEGADVVQPEGGMRLEQWCRQQNQQSS